MIRYFWIVLICLFNFSHSSRHTHKGLSPEDFNHVRRIKSKVLNLYRKQLDRPQAKYILWAQYPPTNWPLTGENKFYGPWSVEDANLIEKNLKRIRFTNKMVADENDSKKSAFQPQPRNVKRPHSPVILKRITRSSAGDYEEFMPPETQNREVKQLVQGLKDFSSEEPKRLAIEIDQSMQLSDFNPGYDEALDSPEFCRDNDFLEPDYFFDIFED